MASAFSGYHTEAKGFAGGLAFLNNLQSCGLTSPRKEKWMLEMVTPQRHHVVP